MKKFGGRSTKTDTFGHSFKVYDKKFNCFKIIKLCKIDLKWEYIAIVKRGFLKFDFYRNGKKERIPLLLKAYLLVRYIPSKEYTIDFWARNIDKRNWMMTGLRVMNIAIGTDIILERSRGRNESFI